MSPQWPCFHRWWKHETLAPGKAFIWNKKYSLIFKEVLSDVIYLFPHLLPIIYGRLIGNLRCSLSVWQFQDYQELLKTCTHFWDDHFSTCIFDLVFLVNILIKVILSKLINMYIVFLIICWWIWTLIHLHNELLKHADAFYNYTPVGAG